MKEQKGWNVKKIKGEKSAREIEKGTEWEKGRE